MFDKVLCSTDGSEHSDIAVEYAAKLAATFNVPLTICTVNVAYGSPRSPIILNWTEDEVAALLNRAATNARAHGANDISTASIVGREAAAGIISYAEERGFSQIVVGTGDKRGFSRLMVGSVAADVVNRAHATVTVAR